MKLLVRRRLLTNSFLIVTAVAVSHSSAPSITVATALINNYSFE